MPTISPDLMRKQRVSWVVTVVTRHDAVHMLDSWQTIATGIVSLLSSQHFFMSFPCFTLFDIAWHRIFRFADDHGAHLLVLATQIATLGQGMASSSANVPKSCTTAMCTLQSQLDPKRVQSVQHSNSFSSWGCWVLTSEFKTACLPWPLHTFTFPEIRQAWEFELLRVFAGFKVLLPS